MHSQLNPNALSFEPQKHPGPFFRVRTNKKIHNTFLFVVKAMHLKISSFVYGPKLIDNFGMPLSQAKKRKSGGPIITLLVGCLGLCDAQFPPTK